MGESFNEALGAALRGEWQRVPPMRELSQSQRVVMAALRALMSDATPPTTDEIRDGDAERAITWAALHAWLRGDSQALLELADLCRSTFSSGSTPTLPLVEGWCALANGDNTVALDPREFAKSGDAAATVIAATLTALSELRRNAPAEGLAHARRAIRMARTEGIVVLEYLAALVLARARRYNGATHYAARVLTSLDQVVPLPWRPWLRWELRLNGVALPAADEDWEAGQILSRVLAAKPFSPPQQALALMAHELEIVANAIDVGAPPHPAIVAWAHPEGSSDSAESPSSAPTDQGSAGQSSIDRPTAGRFATHQESGSTHLSGARPPGVLAGLTAAQLDASGAERASTFIYRGPAMIRRVLRAGLPTSGATIVDGSYALAQARVFTALAVLASHREAISNEDLFRLVYGFDYRAGRDDGTLRILLHRVRKLLPDTAGVKVQRGMVSLVSEGALIVPDPRCAQETDDRVLQFIALQPSGASTKEISRGVGLAVRTIQKSLQRLVEDGACLPVRQGRAIGYRLEDTAFSQPTLERMSPLLEPLR